MMMNESLHQQDNRTNGLIMGQGLSCRFNTPPHIPASRHISASPSAFSNSTGILSCIAFANFSQHQDGRIRGRRTWGESDEVADDEPQCVFGLLKMLGRSDPGYPPSFANLEIGRGDFPLASSLKNPERNRLIRKDKRI